MKPVFIILFLSLNVILSPSSFAGSTDLSAGGDYLKAKQDAVTWVGHLDLNLVAVSAKSLPEKKYLAEYLSFYWMLDRLSGDQVTRKEVLEKIEPFYRYCQSPNYHDLQNIGFRLLRKNAMSYLRVLWLFKQFDLDTSYYENQLSQAQRRLDIMLNSSGVWQREIFKNYYLQFGLELPPALVSAGRNNGLIDDRLEISLYTKKRAYDFTHFIYTAFEYGNKNEQSRFDQQDIKYISEVLPQLTRHYRIVEPDIDLLGEFMTCMVFMGMTDNDEFAVTYKYLIENQNSDGSWGDYEEYRSKIGDDINFRAYLHTTFVVLEALLEYNEGNFRGSLANSQH